MAAAREEKEAVENEIRELIGKKEKEETLYRKVAEKLREYTGSVVRITELQNAIDRQNEMKKTLENSIDSLKRKLAGMRISADVAEALPSIIRGKDMKIVQICAALTAAPDSTAAGEGEIRDKIINDIIEMSEGGIVPVRYSSYDRFISGFLYDRLMKLDRERIRVSEEKSDLERLRNLCGSDVRAYLDDCVSGRITTDSPGYMMIREIAENEFRKEVRQRFDLKAEVEFAKYSGAANPLIFLAAPDASTGSIVVGSIGTRDLTAAIRSDSESIELQTNSGKVKLDTCTAVMEIMEMFMNPATVEMLRKEWRESIISRPDHHERPGMLHYGGLVKNDKGKGRKESG